MNAARHVTLVPFDEAVADACGSLRAVTDPEHLRSTFDYHTGLLRGYYFAGAIAEVQLTAALELLRRIRFATPMRANAPRPTPCAN